MKQITTYPNTDSLALPTPPLAHGPDHAQARALALQVVPPTAYHAQFSVEQRAAYNLAQAYLALTAALAPPQERVSEDAVRVAVEGALCYDCGCESEGPWKCERVIAALSAGRGE